MGYFAHCNNNVSCRNNQALSVYASTVKERFRSVTSLRQVRFEDEKSRTEMQVAAPPCYSELFAKLVYKIALLALGSCCYL